VTPPEPAQTVREVEHKFRVHGLYRIPELVSSGLVSRVDDHGVIEPETAYYDTSELRLVREGMTLRRRTGGHDDGWHLKLQVPGAEAEVRDELRLPLTPGVEQAMVDSGILLLKYWLEVGEAEQTRRLQSRIDDPRKIWKLSGMDLKSYSRWYDYARARDDMFAATDGAWAPWYVVHTDDKRRGRLNLITHLLSQVPYEPLVRKEISFPERQHPGDYTEPNLPLHHLNTPF
jgi:hypothetical protein